MGDLTDQLLKAGLINQKQAKQTKHKQRVKQKTVGHKGLDAEERKKKQDFEKKRDEKRTQDRSRNRKEEEVKLEKVERSQLRNLVRDGAISVSGNRRYYFVTRENKVPYLEVSDDIVRKLQHGQLAIIEMPDQKMERFVVLERNKALQVRETEPDLVRTLVSVRG